jgi:mono/diheme cytochrome c family protein
MCHGPKGDGRGDIAVQQKLRIPDFTDPKIQLQRTDGELFYILGHGHGDMPAEKRLPDRNRWEIILYLRSLARTGVARG